MREGSYDTSLYKKQSSMCFLDIFDTTQRNAVTMYRFAKKSTNQIPFNGQEADLLDAEWFMLGYLITP